MTNWSKKKCPPAERTVSDRSLWHEESAYRFSKLSGAGGHIGIGAVRQRCSAAHFLASINTNSPHAEHLIGGAGLPDDVRPHTRSGLPGNDIEDYLGMNRENPDLSLLYPTARIAARIKSDVASLVRLYRAPAHTNILHGN